MAGRGGVRPGAGRPEGSQNKLTASFKELVQKTFQQLEDEGDGMHKWAKENKSDFYKIASKLIPTEMALKADITQIEIEKTIITDTNFVELPTATTLPDPEAPSDQDQLENES